MSDVPTSAAPTLRAAYERELSSRGYRADPAQLAALEALEALRLQALAAPPQRTLRRLFARATPWLPARAPAPSEQGDVRELQGLYLWGAVGRGKTWLMDLFCASLPLLARRLHFHHFIREVHESLRRLPQRRDPLRAVARSLAARNRVLCLDELFVTDIADAMILGGLFEALLDEQMMLVITSNSAPSGLYQDGLQRARFLPAIALLERRLRIVNVDGGVDYRLRQLQRRPIYLDSADPNTLPRLTALFDELADPHALQTRELTIQGRALKALRRAGEVVWFSFATLCEGPRSQNDYLEIAEDFHTVMLSDVPLFTESQDNAARRFVALIDELYDQGVKLILSAADAPASLYRAERLRVTFQRTTSRLIEMQSETYLARPHGHAGSVARS